jgi:hypothetical protein
MAKITTSNNSGIVSTTSSNTTLTTSSGTTSYTQYNPNIGNTFIYQGVVLRTPTPFNIRFSWDNKEVDISLKNGNDVFKLANAFMEWLDKNGIEYNISTSSKKKKK